MQDFTNLSQEELNSLIVEACDNRDLEKIEYLLTSKELAIHAQINCQYGEPLYSVCSTAYLDGIRFLLTSPKLSEHADIHIDNDAVLRLACSKCLVEIVKYLVKSPELKEHADYSVNYYEALRVASHNQELMHFFLYDLRIQLDSETIDVMKLAKDNRVDTIIDMAHKRDLFFKRELMSNKLEINKKVKKKNKRKNKKKN